MKLRDRARLESAVWRYDTSMDLRGVPLSRRRSERQALRANVREAAEEIGVARALQGVGSVAAMADAVAEGHQRRPRWSVGALGFLAAWSSLMVWFITSALTFVQGAKAVDAVGTFGSDGLWPWLGARFEVSLDEAGQVVSASWDVPIMLFVVPALVGTLTSRPWRMLRRTTG